MFVFPCPFKATFSSKLADCSFQRRVIFLLNQPLAHMKGTPQGCSSHKVFNYMFNDHTCVYIYIYTRTDCFSSPVFLPALLSSSFFWAWRRVSPLSFFPPAAPWWGARRELRGGHAKSGTPIQHANPLRRSENGQGHIHAYPRKLKLTLFARDLHKEAKYQAPPPAPNGYQFVC